MGLPVFNHIDLLGGHKLARLYLNKIHQAKTDTRLRYSHLSFCDPHPQELLQDTDFSETSYADFITAHWQAKDRGPGDILIPDHTAPHVFFRVCLDLIQQEYPQAEVTLAKTHTPLGLPFEMPIVEGVTPLSYATWVCPLECEEPAICPAISSPRTWDFEKFFASFTRRGEPPCSPTQPEFLFLGFACQGLVDGIAHIPWEEITANLQNLKQHLATHAHTKLAVATYSHCHAILGEAVIEL